MSFLKIHYNYEKYARLTDEVSMRRSILTDLKDNYPEIDDISYDLMLNLDIYDLHALIENRKLDVKMFSAAVKIQR